MSLDLPRSMRDPAFRRRLDALDRAGCATERLGVLAVPLVADRPFTPRRDCPRGHVAEHEAGFPPTNHDGTPHVPRRCARCAASWLDRLEP